MSLEALIRLHEGLARLGPGDEDATLRALAQVRPFLPGRPAVADLGCGTGASALVLARELGARPSISRGRAGAPAERGQEGDEGLGGSKDEEPDAASRPLPPQPEGLSAKGLLAVSARSDDEPASPLTRLRAIEPFALNAAPGEYLDGLQEGSILAMDACGVFLEELRRRAEGAELASRIRTREADFADPGLEPGSFDLLWSEGAIYQLGFEAGLRAWRPLLRAGGCLVVSEATWLTAAPPAEIRERWGQWYPAMGTVDSNLEVARAAGFEVLETFPLPASAWWAYYDPLWANCLAAREGAPDAGMRDVIAETELELSMFRRFGYTYGYVFYVLRKGEEER